jgi:phage-related protein
MKPLPVAQEQDKHVLSRIQRIVLVSHYSQASAKNHGRIFFVARFDVYLYVPHVSFFP